MGGIMDGGWGELLRAGAWRRLPGDVYVALTAKLLRIATSTTLIEALTVGLIGGLAAARAGDPVLWGLGGATTLIVLLLPVVPRIYERRRGQADPVALARWAERLFSLHVWAVSLGIGLMAARALLAFDDPVLHLTMIALVLGGAVTNIRDHYRPVVAFGKTIALLGPACLACAMTGILHYQLLAVGGLFMGKLILDLSLELHQGSLVLHEAHAEKARLAASLQARADEAQKLRDDLIEAARLTAMGTMASALAHELNQPLAAIANYARASRRYLKEDGAPGDLAAAREGMECAEAAALRAGDIVRRIRSFVAGESGPRRSEDLARIAQDACAFGLADAHAFGVEYRMTIEEHLYRVQVDPIQVQQVLINLVRNAFEAVKEGWMPMITVSARRLGRSVEVRVTDNGPGLDEAAAATLFEPFRSRKADGMGVGLAISRTIVETHGGRLRWVREARGGATFAFTLPLAEEQADAA